MLVDGNVGITAQLGHDVGDITLRRNHLLLRHLRRVLRLIEGLPRRGAAGDELALPVVFALLIGERVFGGLGVGDLLAIGRLQGVDLEPRRR